MLRNGKFLRGIPFDDIRVRSRINGEERSDRDLYDRSIVEESREAVELDESECAEDAAEITRPLVEIEVSSTSRSRRE